MVKNRIFTAKFSTSNLNYFSFVKGAYWFGIIYLEYGGLSDHANWKFSGISQYDSKTTVVKHLIGNDAIFENSTIQFVGQTNTWNISNMPSTYIQGYII